MTPSLWRRTRYRVQQFGASLWPRVTTQERQLVADLLPGAAAALFQRMPQRDQRHSLNVLHTLQGAGHAESDLAAAALLHDVGKTVHPGRRVLLWHRVIIVLLNAVDATWVARLASEQPSSWRYPFYAHLHHPAQGAALAQQAGCTPLTVDLILRHQARLTAPPASAADQLLIWLQAADDAN
jgi:hypothetical protein